MKKFEGKAVCVICGKKPLWNDDDRYCPVCKSKMMFMFSLNEEQLKNCDLIYNETYSC